MNPELESYRLLAEAVGWFTPTGERWFELVGSDAAEWLQGQITQDVRKNPEQGISFCFCTPTGQIEGTGRAWLRGDRWVICLPEPVAATFERRVEATVILEDVALKPTQPIVTSYQGVGVLESDLGECFANNRLGFGGFDVFNAAGAPEGTELHPATVLSAGLEAGCPLIGCDIDVKAFPQELGPAFELSHVSFNKGCYTGQEVIMRIHSRGRTNRIWVGVIGEQPMKQDDAVLQGGRVVGRITRACPSARYGWVAGAMVKSDTDLVAFALVGGVQVRLSHFPLGG